MNWMAGSKIEHLRVGIVYPYEIKTTQATTGYLVLKI